MYDYISEYNCVTYVIIKLRGSLHVCNNNLRTFMNNISDSPDCHISAYTANKLTSYTICKQLATV